MCQPPVRRCIGAREVRVGAPEKAPPIIVRAAASLRYSTNSTVHLLALEMTHASYWTASDGTQLHYRYDDFTDPWQKAPLVVLLHPGLGSSLRLFGWVPHLARKYRVVRPDIRGHGKSEPGPDNGLTHERLALDLVELFDRFGAERAHVMGSSAGGMIAGRAALRSPASLRLARDVCRDGRHSSEPPREGQLARARRARRRAQVSRRDRARSHRRCEPRARAVVHRFR